MTTTELISIISQKYPTQKRFLSKASEQLSGGELNDLEAYNQFCQKEDLSLDYLAECYLLIVNDTIKEQLYFKKNQKYRYSSFAEVGDAVYHNQAYMQKYMIGLALSTFFWENHREMRNFFIQSLPTHSGGNYLEVGPGHGFFFMSAMRALNFDKFTGVDISKTSVEMTQSILTSNLFGEFKNFEIKQADFLNFNSKQKYDFLVMSEVLEHVEKPELFLNKLREYANHEARIFITTCLNAPAIDHIFLYSNQEMLREQIKNAGLTIEKELWLPYPGQTLEQSFSKLLPVNVAMVLKCSVH
jgi:2-polyprenyl-3-methyl-5-hydroxy-6-metoxy-1,4-benzoquinol methylase